MKWYNSCHSNQHYTQIYSLKKRHISSHVYRLELSAHGFGIQELWRQDSHCQRLPLRRHNHPLYQRCPRLGWSVSRGFLSSIAIRWWKSLAKLTKFETETESPLQLLLLLQFWLRLKYITINTNNNNNNNNNGNNVINSNNNTKRGLLQGNQKHVCRKKMA